MPKLLSIAHRRFGEQWDISLALEGGLEGRTARALVHRPISFTPDRPVLVVMHGVTRAADQYMASWMGLSEKMGFLLVVPEFTKASWPDARSYNLGNMRRPDGAINPRSDWSFSVLEDLVETAQREAGSRAQRFALYGHSAGAQFVHRYVLFVGGQRLTGAVAANAGWYTMPTSASRFPYGIADMPHAVGNRASAFSTPLTILLGADDTDENDPDLRKTGQAMRQGPHRVARGHTFHAVGQAEAQRLGIACNWSIEEVAGVAHNDRDLAERAAAILLGRQGARRSQPTSGYRRDLLDRSEITHTAEDGAAHG